MSKLVQKQHVLIIEDSQATALLLKTYMNKMGYEEVHTCQNGKTGVDTFKDLVNAGSEPFVLLDFMLPDMDALSIMTQLLEIKPDVKIILQTATEKTDSGVTELIRQGLYQYLEKPIRFDKLKDIITILEEEQQILEQPPTNCSIIVKLSCLLDLKRKSISLKTSVVPRVSVVGVCSKICCSSSRIVIMCFNLSNRIGFSRY